MSLSFDEAFDRLIGHEGGYVNNPLDPGGETNWGISKRSYPNVDIKALTRDGAKAIYLQDFWNPIMVAGVTPEVAFQLFDFAVNSGIGNALRALQKAAGVAPDGHIGPATQAAVGAVEVHDLAMLVLAERLEFMTGLTGWQTFGKGWARRIASNLRYAAGDIL